MSTMRVSAQMLLAGSFLVLAACGGGSAGSTPAAPIQVNPAPTPTPTPVPSPTPAPAPASPEPIIFAAKSSQTFASEGRYITSDGGITVSFDAASKQYFATTPADTTPRVLQPDPQVVPATKNFVLANGFHIATRASGGFSGAYQYFYSNLAFWSQTDQLVGTTAFGITTASSGVPQAGSITYYGFLEGVSSERYSWEGSKYFGSVDGPVTLVVDFSTRTATLTVTPRLGLAEYHNLPSISSAQIVLPKAAVEFHQPVFGSPESLDFPVSGLFTGPAAEELIGGIRFQYTSPIDGSMRTVGAAFIAKRTTG